MAAWGTAKQQCPARPRRQQSAFSWPRRRRNMNGLDVRSILFLGRALYDSERMEEAKRLMAAAVHLHPHNHVLQFNAAMCMQKSATSRLDRMRKLKAFTPVEAAAGERVLGHARVRQHQSACLTCLCLHKSAFDSPRPASGDNDSAVTGCHFPHMSPRLRMYKRRAPPHVAPCSGPSDRGPRPGPQALHRPAGHRPGQQARPERPQAFEITHRLLQRREGQYKACFACMACSRDPCRQMVWLMPVLCTLSFDGGQLRRRGCGAGATRTQWPRASSANALGPFGLSQGAS